MNHYCCVPQCTSWVKRNPELSFHSFPKPGKSKVFVRDKFGNKELVDKRFVWISKLKIGRKVSDYMRVCSLHFAEEDYLQKVRMKRRTLKFYAVPSLNLPVLSVSTVGQPGPSSRQNTVASTSKLKDLKTSEEFMKDEAVICEVVGVENDEDREVAETLIQLINST